MIFALVVIVSIGPFAIALRGQEQQKGCPEKAKQWNLKDCPLDAIGKWRPKGDKTDNQAFQLKWDEEHQKFVYSGKHEDWSQDVVRSGLRNYVRFYRLAKKEDLNPDPKLTNAPEVYEQADGKVRWNLTLTLTENWIVIGRSCTFSMERKFEEEKLVWEEVKSEGGSKEYRNLHGEAHPAATKKESFTQVRYYLPTSGSWIKAKIDPSASLSDEDAREATNAVNYFFGEGETLRNFTRLFEAVFKRYLGITDRVIKYLISEQQTGEINKSACRYTSLSLSPYKVGSDEVAYSFITADTLDGRAKVCFLLPSRPRAAGASGTRPELTLCGKFNIPEEGTEPTADHGQVMLQVIEQ